MDQSDLLFLQQSLNPTAGLYLLEPHRAMSLHAQEPSVLRAGVGGLWLTSSRCPGDHFLSPSQRWRAAKGERLVIEAWHTPAGQAARFAWDAVPAAVTITSLSEWAHAVRDTRAALALLGHAALHALRGFATFLVAVRAGFTPAAGRFGFDFAARAATAACKAN